MKKFFSLVCLVWLISLGTCHPALADQSSAGRQTIFNNVTDFFATLGKSPQDAAEIKSERKADRKEQRLREEARQKRANTRQQMQAQSGEIMRKENAPYTK